VGADDVLCGGRAARVDGKIDLVPGGEADQVGEALDRDRIAVMDELGDGVAHRCDLVANVTGGGPILPQ